MSVPRPAMLVASVIAPFSPALAIISASRAWFLAFNISCFSPALVKSELKYSLTSTEIVPIRIGWPVSWICLTALTIDLYLPAIFE